VGIRVFLSVIFITALIFESGRPLHAQDRGNDFIPSAINELYTTAYDEVINRHVIEESDGTTYVSTGDIPAEWLRDASAIADAYVGLARTDGNVAQTLKGVVRREGRYILIDPYANAFSSDYKVVEEKFEVDSLMYPIWFAYDYWHKTGDGSFFNGRLSLAFDRVLHVLHVEQHHAQRSRYHNPELADGGRGTPVGYTGMVWTGFRPSDDPATYQYNIPDNMFAVVVLRDLATIERQIYHNRRKESDAWGLSVQIERGIEQYGHVNLAGFGRIYAYEVDGRGHALLMDDANVPSLLAAPYFGYLDDKDPAYQATRRFILSTRNPYFYSGKYASGIGSPHTPRGYVWPLSLVMQALTAQSETEVDRVLGYLVASDTGDHRLHESFNVQQPAQFTRADFAWPNAVYTELIRTRRSIGLLPQQ
jgi:uncharacterized protein